MNKRRCINCGRMFYPQKHIKNQRYCSRKECQNARKKEWAKYRLKHDKNYKTYRKAIHDKWKINHPYYWRYYKKNITEKNKTIEESVKKMESKKPILKILIEKNTLTDLPNEGVINCDCRLVLISQKNLLKPTRS